MSRTPFEQPLHASSSARYPVRNRRTSVCHLWRGSSPHYLPVRSLSSCVHSFGRPVRWPSATPPPQWCAIGEWKFPECHGLASPSATGFPECQISGTRGRGFPECLGANGTRGRPSIIPECNTRGREALVDEKALPRVPSSSTRGRKPLPRVPCSTTRGSKPLPWVPSPSSLFPECYGKTPGELFFFVFLLQFF
jgi:hypothetical protein